MPTQDAEKDSRGVQDLTFHGDSVDDDTGRYLSVQGSASDEDNVGTDIGMLDMQGSASHDGSMGNASAGLLDGQVSSS